MTDPLRDPPRDDPSPTPFAYSDEDIQYLCTSWELTDQQRRALPLLLQWRVPKEIARLMALSTSTVRNLIQAISIRAELHDGADGIRKEAAVKIAWHRSAQEKRSAEKFAWERPRNERKEP